MEGYRAVPAVVRGLRGTWGAVGAAQFVDFGASARRTWWLPAFERFSDCLLAQPCTGAYPKLGLVNCLGEEGARSRRGCTRTHAPAPQSDDNNDGRRSDGRLRASGGLAREVEHL